MSASTKDDEIMDRVLDAISPAMNACRTKDERLAVATALMMVGYNVLRGLECDQFVLGWLESAVADVKNNPVAVGNATQH